MFSEEDLLSAYRKAKFTAFRDTNCANGVKFAEFESDLRRNLKKLRKVANGSFEDWTNDVANLGQWTRIPKSGLDPSDTHILRTDPFEEWQARWAAANKRITAKRKQKETAVKFRPVFDATAEFHVLSTLWCITSGARFDATLDRKHIYGGRLKRTGEFINKTSAALFSMYQFAYGAWQRNGLRRIRNAVNDGDDIVAVTMDIKQFYHRVSAAFVTRKEFLENPIPIAQEPHEARLTETILNAINTANRAGKQPLGLPVGLSCSTVLANSLLRQLDQAILEGVSPVYYGRYIDDVFLVIKPGKKFKDEREFMEWLADRCPGTIQQHRNNLRIEIAGANDSNLEFGIDKQKVFQLSGKYGLDLIEPIERRLREQSSAVRQLPVIPDDDGEIATNVLRLSISTQEVNGLRKADDVSLRRADFATLLSKADAYSRALSSQQYESVRRTLFSLAERHLLEPSGFFELSRYIPRIFRLAGRGNDPSEIKLLVRSARSLKDSLDETVGKVPTLKSELESCWDNIGRTVLEAILTTRETNTDASHPAFLLRTAWPKLPIVEWLNTWAALRSADWLDQSYGREWIEQPTRAERTANAGTESVAPEISSLAIPSEWHWNDVLQFAGKCNLPIPDWRPILFPTRTIPASIICMKGSRAGFDVNARTLTGLRTTWYSRRLTPRRPREKSANKGKPPFVSVEPLETSNIVRIVVANTRIEQDQWRKAALGAPDLSRQRYETINRFVNRLMDDYVHWFKKSPKLPTYLIAPELYIPQKWWQSITRRLGRLGINIITGVEYREAPGGRVFNEIAIGLSNKYLHQDLYMFSQKKRAPAWDEENELRKLLGGVGLSKSSDPRPIYEHGKFTFAALVCNELTDIAARAALRGHVDALVIPEWNRDIGSFSTLVESASLDVHAFIIQSNNRTYGDSRVRSPAKKEWHRDVVRVKGGVEDHFVSADLDIRSLRKFQTTAEPHLGEDADYKPFPTGFSISTKRRTP